jgi:hypothetical protein
MRNIDLKDKDKELLDFSHTRTVELPTGVRVEIVVYKFKNDENTFRRIATSGLVGQIDHKDAWSVMKWGHKF